MPNNPEKPTHPEPEAIVYVISKCWLEEDSRVLSVPLFGLHGELTNADEVAGCVAVLNATEEARFGPDARFFYSYKAFSKQLIDKFPFG